MTVHTDTSRSDDLVKRLRGFYCGDMGEPADPINPDGPEAADRIEELTSMEECLTAELGDANDRIEALEAENERLREALQSVLTESVDIECGDRVIYSDHVNAIRAALGEKQ